MEKRNKNDAKDEKEKTMMNESEEEEGALIIGSCWKKRT